MSTMWFEKKPGESVAQGIDEPEALLIGAEKPDWVRLPPNLGGAQVRVTGSFNGPCVSCKDKHTVRHLTLEGGISVAECGSRGFLWYRVKAA